MQSGPHIGAREREILTAIVETFIATGEPVGSRTLARANREGLSPATIRNVMADLSDAGLLELTGLWHWGPAPYHLRVVPGGMLDLRPVNTGRASRFRPLGEDSWLGLDGYYAGETLRVGRTADGTPAYLDLATFIFTRTPYDPLAPIPGGVDEAG